MGMDLLNKRCEKCFKLFYFTGPMKIHRRICQGKTNEYTESNHKIAPWLAGKSCTNDLHYVRSCAGDNDHSRQEMNAEKDFETQSPVLVEDSDIIGSIIVIQPLPMSEELSTCVMKNEMGNPFTPIKTELESSSSGTIPHSSITMTCENKMQCMKTEKESTTNKMESMTKEFESSLSGRLEHSDATTATSDKMYECGICCKQYNTHFLLILHTMAHASFDNKLQCPICYKTLPDIKTRNRHIRSHTGENPYLCCICNSEFSNSRTMLAHSRSSKCKHKSFPTNISQNRTQKTTNLNTMKMFKKYAQNIDGVKHKLIYARNKIYSCSHCNKQFNYKANLDKHRMSVHRRNWTYKLYQCSCCEHTFRVQQGLLQRQSSAQETSYLCRKCHEPFSCIGSLKKHLQNHHVGRKLYVCMECEQTFTLRCNLDFHMRKHTNTQTAHHGKT